MRALRAVSVVLVLLASSCISGPVPGGIPAALAGALRSFSDCDELLGYLQGHALERVTPWGLPGAWGGHGIAVAEALAADAESPGAVSDQGYSTTNVQVAGVDEPDIVKTDGERLVALSQGRLFVVDLSDEGPRLQGSLRLEGFWARDMLVLGDRALLLGEGGWEPPRAFLEGDVAVSPTSSVTALVEVDLSDPERPRMARRLLVEGGYVSARMIAGVARVVVSSFPAGLGFEYPEEGGLRAEREALRRNREVIRGSTVESWLPAFVLEDQDGGTLAEGTLLDCASAFQPPEFSGFGTLTVLTVDLASGLDESVTDRSVGVASDGQTVYASPESLYVATQRWVDWDAVDRGDREALEGGQVTRIHRFDITGPDAAAYRSSGRVPGWLLNQFSMDEHDGRLRVASTTSGPFWEGGGDSESMVTVLEEGDGRLVEVGRVSGLGKGERIFAVRFLGDRGYVVTFREVDPLYVLDLSDPTAPSVEGELKILGYSAYLHPVGDGLLLGVGQDATSQGRLKGTQLSLFDVSDPGAPRRIDALRIGGGSSEVEWDHHAFLHWEPEGLVVVPVNVWGWRPGAGEEGFSGALAVRLADGSLEEVARLRHDQGSQGGWGPGIRRTLVVGELLLTLSDDGVEAVDLTTLEDVAWVPFRGSP